jgi:hypothetical protein
MGCAPSSTVHALEVRLHATETRLAKLEEKLEQQQQSHQHKESATKNENNLAVAPPHVSKPRPSSSSSQNSMQHRNGEQSSSTIAGIHPILISPTPKPFPQPTKIPTQQEKLERRIEFDVFLSHKRTDCADFARTLKTELTDIGGLTCFLDQDADFELGDLMSKVRGSATLIFILSDHIFESEWCLLELREALLWGCNVILLTAHGAKWIVDGHTHDFPPAKLIRPEIAPAFANKAIEYNRNFHKASIEQLMQRMYGRPVQAGLAKWTIPIRSYEEPANFLVDLAAVEPTDPLYLALPPQNTLSVLHGLFGWNAPANEALSCGLSTPFHIASDTTASPSSPSKQNYVLSAELANPWRLEPERSFPSTSWNALVLDAPPLSIQTGVWKLDTEQRSGIEMKAGSTMESLPVTFPIPFRSTPEVFVFLNKFQSHGRKEKDIDNTTWTIFSLRAQHIESKGFSLLLWASSAPGAKFRERTQYEIDELSVAWLAYDAKFNRSMVHGELWLVNEENHRREITSVIHFSGGFSGPSRTSFTEPPLVFLSLGGMDSDTSGWSIEFSVKEVTTTQATIVWHMHHRYHVPAAQMFSKFGSSATPASISTDAFSKFGSKALNAPAPTSPEERPPCRVAIHWIALPANKVFPGANAAIGAPHSAASSSK